MSSTAIVNDLWDGQELPSKIDARTTLITDVRDCSLGVNLADRQSLQSIRLDKLRN